MIQRCELRARCGLADVDGVALDPAVRQQHQGTAQDQLLAVQPIFEVDPSGCSDRVPIVMAESTQIVASHERYYLHKSRKLLDVLERFGIATVTDAARKEAMRDLILRTDRYSEADWLDIVAYCWEATRAVQSPAIRPRLRHGPEKAHHPHLSGDAGARSRRDAR
jgi:hypothetical protein